MKHVSNMTWRWEATMYLPLVSERNRRNPISQRWKVGLQVRDRKRKYKLTARCWCDGVQSASPDALFVSGFTNG